MGITGLPSLAHAGFFAVGAYTAGLVAKDISAARRRGAARGRAAAGVAAAVTGWLTVRSRGIFFLMLTLAVGEIIFLLAESLQDVTGGSNGLFGIPVMRGRPGQRRADPAGAALLVRARRASASASACCGRSPARRSVSSCAASTATRSGCAHSATRRGAYKFGAFCIAGAVAGLAGALLAAHQQGVTPADAAFGTAVVALVSVIIGGAGTLWGPCLGAAVVVLVRDEIGPSLGGHGPLLLGLVFVAAVYLLPGRDRRRGRARLRRRPG